MKLHENRDVFTEIVEITADEIGLPQVYVEKDYWVTQALKNLSESDYADKVVFKGGTSLSKAYGLIQRFSEDIDLAVIAPWQGDSARKRLLKNVEASVSKGFRYIQHDARESKGSRFRKTVYRYPRSSVNTGFGQVSPELLIEINAFTCPEPREEKVLQPVIAQVLSAKNNAALIDQFGLNHFPINVLSVRRTLVEKLLGVIKDSYSSNPEQVLSNRIRHLYDICLILREEEYRSFVQGDKFEPLCIDCIEDERAGFFKYSLHLEKPLSEAPLFSGFAEWQNTLNITYTESFSDLVYGELPKMSEISETINFLFTCLQGFSRR